MTEKPVLLLTAPFIFTDPNLINPYFNCIEIPIGKGLDSNFVREFINNIFENGVKDSNGNLVKHINGIYMGMGGWTIFDRENFFSKLDTSILKCIQIIANHGAGYDNIDATAAAENGILVTNTPEVVASATAEIAMALMLNVSRNIRDQEESLRQGKWKTFNIYGNNLEYKTVGIIGMGSIGKRVARMAQAFQMKVIYYNRTRIENEKELGVEYRSKEDLLKESDFISLHCPLTEESRHLLSKNEFSLMKPTAFVINTSRGPVIDEKALIEALQTGTIKGAGLDVHEYEPKITEAFLHLKNVSLLPHIGTHTVETRIEMESLCLKNLKLVLVDQSNPCTPVPECKHLL